MDTCPSGRKIRGNVVKGLMKEMKETSIQLKPNETTPRYDRTGRRGGEEQRTRVMRLVKQKGRNRGRYGKGKKKR